jgi:hypothetical protein
MSTIPLKSNTGTITLLENGTIEIKKFEMYMLIPKKSINRVNISSEGRVIIYQSNTTYSPDHDFKVDKVNVPRIREMFSEYLNGYDEPECSNLATSAVIIQEYKNSIRMIVEQLTMVRNFNIDYSTEVENRFEIMQKKIDQLESAKARPRPKTYNYVKILMMLIVLSWFLYNLNISVLCAKKILAEKDANKTYPVIELPILHPPFEHYVSLESF